MKYALLIVVMVLMVGMFHMLFIMVDYVFIGDEHGAFPIMQDKLNDTWNIQTKNSVQNMSVMLKQFFGIGRVVIIVLIPVACVLMAVRKPKIE